MQAHRNEGIVQDVFSAAIYDLDQQHSDLFMKNSVISDPEPLEQTVDISHLSKYEKAYFYPLKIITSKYFQHINTQLAVFPFGNAKF